MAVFATAFVVLSVAILSTAADDPENIEGAAGDNFSISYDSDAYSLVYKVTSESPAIAEVSGFTGTLPSVLSIPSSVNYDSTDYDITSIGDDVFSKCTGLTTVTMPNVETIGYFAFSECTGLTTVNMPSVTFISECAFYKCTELTTVTMPNVETVEPYAFDRCTKLTSMIIDESNPNYSSDGGVLFNHDRTVLMMYPAAKGNYTVPGSVISIWNYAFVNCTGLTSVNMLNVTNIGEFAFYGCSGLTAIDIPNVTSVGNSAFVYCAGLTTVTMPNVEIIEYGAFDSCTGLMTVTMPNVETIRGFAFNKCTKLTSMIIDESNPNYSSDGGILFNHDRTVLITYPAVKGNYVVPDSVTSLLDYAFYGCTGLISITMLNVTNIGDLAFAYCTGLTTITVPNVASIRGDAFQGCTGLKVAAIPFATDIEDDSFQGTKIIEYTGNDIVSVTAYVTDTGESMIRIIVNDGMTVSGVTTETSGTSVTPCGEDTYEVIFGSEDTVRISVTTGPKGNDDDGNIMLFIAIGAVVAVIALAAVYFLMIRKP